jgi:hypothetical protein
MKRLLPCSALLLSLVSLACTSPAPDNVEASEGAATETTPVVGITGPKAARLIAAFKNGGEARTGTFKVDVQDFTCALSLRGLAQIGDANVDKDEPMAGLTVPSCTFVGAEVTNLMDDAMAAKPLLDSIAAVGDSFSSHDMQGLHVSATKIECTGVGTKAIADSATCKLTSTNDHKQSTLDGVKALRLVQALELAGMARTGGAQFRVGAESVTCARSSNDNIEPTSFDFMVPSYKCAVTANGAATTFDDDTRALSLFEAAKAAGIKGESTFLGAWTVKCSTGGIAACSVDYNVPQGHGG